MSHDNSELKITLVKEDEDQIRSDIHLHLHSEDDAARIFYAMDRARAEYFANRITKEPSVDVEEEDS